MKNRFAILHAALIFVLIGVPAAFSAEAVADYQKIIMSMPEYSAALKSYDDAVVQAKNKLETQTKTAKSDTERQQLVSNYNKFCTEQKHKAFDPLIEKMKSVLKQVAAERGCTKVTAKTDGVMGIDITQDTLNRMGLATGSVPVSGNNTNVLANNKPVQPAAIPTPQETAKILQQNNAAKDKANVEVQFSAGYNKDAIYAIVARAAKNGVKNAYVAEAKDNHGKTLWRARASVKNNAEAKDLCVKLSRIGLSSFIVR